jgi:hypothetical protein
MIHFISIACLILDIKKHFLLYLKYFESKKYADLLRYWAQIYKAFGRVETRLTSHSRVARLAWTHLTIKIKTQLGSFYAEFESSRVELRVTRLTHEFRVLVPGLVERVYTWH